MSCLAEVDTAAVDEPVSLAEFKDHLRITGDDENINLQRLLKTATDATETILQSRLINTTMLGYLTEIPSGDMVALLPSPVGSITEVKYYATDNTSQTWDSDSYTLDTSRSPCRLVRNHGYSWPSATRTWNPIHVKFVAGYGTKASEVPWEIRHAIKLMGAHWWDQRMPLNIGNIVNEIPNQAKSLLAPYRVMVFGVK